MMARAPRRLDLNIRLHPDIKIFAVWGKPCDHLTIRSFVAF